MRTYDYSCPGGCYFNLFEGYFRSFLPNYKAPHLLAGDTQCSAGEAEKTPSASVSALAFPMHQDTSWKVRGEVGSAGVGKLEELRQLPLQRPWR